MGVNTSILNLNVGLFWGLVSGHWYFRITKAQNPVICMLPQPPQQPFQPIQVVLPETFIKLRKKIVLINSAATVLLFIGFLLLSFWFIDIISEELGAVILLELSAGISFILLGCLLFFVAYFILQISLGSKNV